MPRGPGFPPIGSSCEPDVRSRSWKAGFKAGAWIDDDDDVSVARDNQILAG